MKVALIDDDKTVLLNLGTLIKKELFSLEDTTCTVSGFDSGESFFESFQRGKYDLIVIDMYMGGIMGIDVARKIRESDGDVRLVFCTTSNEFASESYEVGASYYLLKPFTDKSVRQMIDRLGLDAYELAKHITLSTGHTVLLRNVIYTEYFSHNVIFHQKRGGDLSARTTHTEVENILCEYDYFISCSKGIIVNFHEVRTQKENNFIMTNGAIVPISRRRYKEVIDAYTAFRFRMTRKELMR